MIGIVEGFEEDVCRIEVEGQMRNVPCSQVGKEVKPGDVVEWKDGLWLTNRQKTEARSKEIQRLMDDVWED
ncbi:MULTISPECIES: DUF3006 domain-containing protein [unclassified Paenibacillus]|uniref:DUF3006 domain-containing protein n=1 Tax=unclassified Paenibacillus TaxID=185978 RepID=UPI000839D519|nr:MULTISPECIES: DUF3006 domain-containing protein [unclassified Paenibacillus]NWL89541.1 DUF3006 domain-containing protein [Paenibacillus sp. 79R4]